MPAGELTHLLPNFTAGLQVPVTLQEALAIPLVDHHVRTTFRGPIDLATFEASLNEGSPDPIPPFMTMFDAPLGIAIRRWCAPILDLGTFAEPLEYWDRRLELGDDAVAARMLPAAAISDWLVDTGHSGESITEPAALQQVSGGRVHEVLRLEALAERVVGAVAAGDYPAALRSALTESAAADRVVGFKSIAAYRCGFDIDWSEPDDAEVIAAVQRWQQDIEAGGGVRCTDPCIIAFGVHAALRAKIPLQLHVGFGDRTLDLHRVDPMYLLPLLRHTNAGSTPILLLHSYPFHRQAGYLAQSFDNVYFDIGLSVNHLGPFGSGLIRESLELAPFAKQLYSSGAFGTPELHLLGSVLWRRGMADVLAGLIDRTDLNLTMAVRVASMIGRENATRVYEL